MKTIVVKVKFKMPEVNETKTVKVGLDFPKSAIPCFAEIVDEVYKVRDPKLYGLFGVGYIIGVEEVFD
ncbi:hypothetical protein BT401P1_00020 [Bacteroides phage BT401P1]|nr:hypothetical protein BT401P1_00020 [Bacteroides phage BT401P1]